MISLTKFIKDLKKIQLLKKDALILEQFLLLFIEIIIMMVEVG